MPVSKNNRKIPCPNVATPPGKACGNCKLCFSTCYARKAYRMYPNVRKAWDHNLDLAQNHPDKYWRMIRNYLDKHDPRWFRWHVSGDILDQEYLHEMYVIADNYPQVRFLCFTKMFKFNFSHTPDNLSIVFSRWPGDRKPRNPWGFRQAWMQDGTEKRIPKDAIECPGLCDNCMLCWNLKDIGRDVWFSKH